MTVLPGGQPPVVGLRREREVLTVALRAGRHVVIEGPPGSGKSTLLRQIARDAGADVVFVEGNAELTPARLIGQYDPGQVLTAGYVPGSFSDGPLLRAMRAGSLLYLEEFNRIPEETLNVLITVLTEGEIAVPRLGVIAAGIGFRLIGAMNPFDAVGTARVSQAIADRICRIVVGYQDAAGERAITTAVTGECGPAVAFAVRLTRATRKHRDVAMGSSVRGAIDLTLLLTGLMRLRGEAALARGTAADAAQAALSGRIKIADGCARSPESVIDELLGALWPDGQAALAGLKMAGQAERGPAATDDGTAGHETADHGRFGRQGGRGKADGLPAATGRPGGSSRSRLRRERATGNTPRTFGRAELAARHASFAAISPVVGGLDARRWAELLAADPDAAATLLADLARATDRELAIAARQLAARVFVRLGTVGHGRSAGIRRLGPGRGEGDLDLGRTLDRLSGGWPPPADELVTRSWLARRRAICLLIDASGSMAGLAVAIAAVVAAGLVLAAPDGADTGIVVFGAQPRVVKPLTGRREPGELVGQLVTLRGRGLTDLAAALRAAASQLAGAAAGQRLTVLLSDCLRTTGADPASALAGIDRLHVLCPLPTAESARAAAALAGCRHGISLPVRGLADVPSALTRVLADPASAG